MWRLTILLDKNPKVPKIYDRRFNPPYIILKKPSGYDDDLLVQDVDEIKVDEIHTKYFTPNMTAIKLSFAKKVLYEAEQLREKIVRLNEDEDKHSDQFNRKALIEDSKVVCDYIETIQAAVVFSVSAVEAFSNISIPNDYIYKATTNKKTEIFNKAQIERWIDWKTKLTKILPEIYMTEKIQNKKYWAEYCSLVKVRDDIIHQKSFGDTAFLERLFERKIFGLCKSARKIVMFFKESLNTSRKKMAGNERLWPLLDEKILTLGAIETTIKVKDVEV